MAGGFYRDHRMFPRDAYRETFDVFKYKSEAILCADRLRRNGADVQIDAMSHINSHGEQVMTWRVVRIGSDRDYYYGPEDSEPDEPDEPDEESCDDYGCDFDDYGRSHAVYNKLNKEYIYKDKDGHYRRARPSAQEIKPKEPPKPSNIRENKVRKIFIIEE